MIKTVAMAPDPSKHVCPARVIPADTAIYTSSINTLTGVLLGATAHIPICATKSAVANPGNHVKMKYEPV